MKKPTEQQKAYCYAMSDLEIVAFVRAHGFYPLYQDGGIWYFDRAPFGTGGSARYVLDNFDKFKRYREDLLRELEKE